MMGLILAVVRLGIGDKGPLRGKSYDQAALAELTRGTTRRQMRDPVLRREIAFPWEAGARPKLTLGNASSDVIGHLHVDVRDLAWVDWRLP